MGEFYIGAGPRKGPDYPRLGRGRKGQPRTTKTPVLAVVQRPPDAEEGATAGEARARVVDDLSEAEAHRVLSENIETTAHLMSDEWKSFVSIGQAFAAHDTVRHSEREYARGFVPIQRKASMTAFAAPLPACSIISVRNTPISISTRSVFAGRNG